MQAMVRGRGAAGTRMQAAGEGSEGLGSAMPELDVRHAHVQCCNQCHVK